MSRVHWSDAAIRDVAELRVYLSELSEQTAQTITDRIVLATDWLLEWPSAGREIGASGWRKWAPRRTGHVLIYRAIDGGIEISRVRHERENWMADL